MTRFAFLVALATAATVASPPPLASAGEAEDLRKVLDAWAARRDARTLAADYSGTIFYPRGSMNAFKVLSRSRGAKTVEWPPEDYAGPVAGTILLDPGRERAAVTTRTVMFHANEDEPGLQRQNRRLFLDGETWQVQEGHDDGGFSSGGSSRPDLEFGTKASMMTWIGLDPLPILLSAGYFQSNTRGGRLPTGEVPSAAGHAAHGYVTRDGRRLLVIRSEADARTRGYDEYWADPGADGEIAHAARHARSGVKWEVDVRFEGRPGVGRVPAEWTIREYLPTRGGSRPLQRETQCELIDYSRGLAVAEDDFHVDAKPGWILRNHDILTGGKPETYVQPIPGGVPGDVAEVAGSWAGSATLTAIGVAVAAAAAVVAWKLRRRHPAGT